MTMVTAGELLIRTLARAGVEKLFALHGAHLETLFQACIDNDIAVLDTRHEVAAGHAAEAYARTARKLGVAMITAGPGFTNVITSMANAWLDRTPVLYLAGSAALRDAETNTLQAGIDQVAIARPITKWAQQITTADQLPRLVAEAVRITTGAPTGPVLLDLPIDILTTMLDEDSVPLPDNLLLDSPPAPTAELMDQAINLLNRAERPVMMIGGDVWASHGEQELIKFVEQTGIPVYSDFAGHGVLPSSHPLYGGTFHKMADLEEPHRPDVILILGTRLGLFTLGGTDILIPKRARLIHIDVDAKELGKLRPVALPVAAGSREALRALNQIARETQWPDFSAWQSLIMETKQKRRARFADAAARKKPPIHPYQAVSTIIESLPRNTVIIGDGAESYHWLNEVIAQEQGGGYLTHGFLGAVGFGLGLALGAAWAHPGRPVLCIAGDGAVGFTLIEFDTMVRHKLPIVVVVMNNSSWGASQHFQEIVSGKDRLLGTQLSTTRYHDVAAGFGCYAEEVTELEQLAPALQKAFASGTPACINVIIDQEPLPPEVGLLMQRH